MPIPLYYAANWKEIVNNSKKRWAQTGFGFNADGSARIPQHVVPGMPCVIDDAVLPAISEEAVQALSQYCVNGCYLDFERPVSERHSSLLRLLRGRTSRSKLFAVPARFAAEGMLPVLSCPTPCNSWEAFLSSAERRFPTGWMLELIPWDRFVPGTGGNAALPAKRLSQAVCFLRTEKNGVRYYDTPETLQAKLSMAERRRCAAAIGLYQELAALSAPPARREAHRP